ncbi:MAG: hypothetical protein ACI9R3_006330 [Verrucomicrobiales bacterium]|jgi:hypothetical protein
MAMGWLSTRSSIHFATALPMFFSYHSTSSPALPPWCRARAPHLVRYHGLFAPNAKHRDHIVARPAPTAQPGDDILEAKPTTAMNWMQRLLRVFAVDISTCPRCGGNVRVIAAITQPALSARILEHRAAVDAPGASAPPGASLH